MVQRVNIFLVLLLTACMGCDSDITEKSDLSKPQAYSSVPIRIAVFESEELAERIALGWQGYAEQEAAAVTFDEDSLVDRLRRSDVVVMPARLLGTAVHSRLIDRLPPKFVRKAMESDFAKVLPQLRQNQISWQNQELALSLGSPVPVLLLNVALEDVIDRQALSYAKFAELVEKVSEDQPMAAEPLADGEAALTLLRRAASASDVGWLFDSETMEAQLDQPAFVRSLEHLVALRAYYPKELLSSKQIWQRMVSGDLKLAIGLPIESADVEESASVLVHACPQYSSVFSDGQWRSREDEEQPRALLTGDGLIVCVAKSCRQTDAARDLLKWLVIEGKDSMRRVSYGVTEAHTEDYLEDVSGRMKSVAISEYDQQVRKYLALRRSHTMLRIPGVSRYLAALDDAILSAISGEVLAADALKSANAKWNVITSELGRKSQSDAWQASMKL